MERTVQIGLDRLDAALMRLGRIQGQFGAMLYMMNPEGLAVPQPAADVEEWLRDVRDRIEGVVDILTKRSSE